MSQPKLPYSFPLHFFVLGRERKLSVAEILAVFPSARVEHLSDLVLVVSGIATEDLLALYPTLGGSIFAGGIFSVPQSSKSTIDACAAYVADALADDYSEGKLLCSLSSYPERRTALDDALMLKRRLKSKTERPVRIVNPPNGANPGAVLLRKQGVLDGGYALARVAGPGGEYLGHILCAQDVDAYAGRDLGKRRDMQVGMLPPKLAGLMCNLAGVKDSVYDPFCGLGTVLIEAAAHGAKDLYATDISPDMAEATRASLREYGAAVPDAHVFALDAKRVEKVAGLVPAETPIVTEWFLGPVLSAQTVTRGKALDIDRDLAGMYDAFFGGLRRMGWRGPIVISFPCWQVGRETIEPRLSLSSAQKHGFALSRLLPSEAGGKVETSLLYRRPGQTVGRLVCRFRAS